MPMPSMRRARTTRTARPTCTSGSTPPTPRRWWPPSRPRSPTPIRRMPRPTRPMRQRLHERLDALDRTLADAARAPWPTARTSCSTTAISISSAATACNAVGAITINPTRRPGAQRLGEIRARLQELDAACVFAEPQFEPALVDTVIEGTSARKGVLDPLGAAFEAGPGAIFPAARMGSPARWSPASAQAVGLSRRRGRARSRLFQLCVPDYNGLPTRRRALESEPSMSLPCRAVPRDRPAGRARAARAPSGPAVAHPHVWITDVTTFLFEGPRAGRPCATAGQFDEIFSSFVIEEHDANGDGASMPAETAGVQEGAFSNLEDYDYFTHARIDGDPQPLTEVRGFPGDRRRRRPDLRVHAALARAHRPGARQLRRRRL